MCVWIIASGLLSAGLMEYLGNHGANPLWGLGFWFVMFLGGLAIIGPTPPKSTIRRVG